MSCVKPWGYVERAGDCNDQDPAINPVAIEIVDGKDNNCNGQIDENTGCVIKVWYIDYDGDKFGRVSRTKMSCVQPNGYVPIAGDCNDQDPTINPDAIEICDGKDNNCDGVKDENCNLITSVEGVKPAAKADVDPEKLEASLWPNPAKTELIVAIDEFIPNKKIEMLIITADGRAIQSKNSIPKLKGEQIIFDVRNMPSGYYLLLIKQGSLTKTKRVIVAR
jgi:hypothetical protein